MKTSARNTLAGTVSKITEGAVNSEVQLTLSGSDTIVAIITNSSVNALGLKLGQRALALIKASWIILGRNLHNVKLSARNVLCGTVAEIREGAVNGEVIMDLVGGAKLTSIVTEHSLESLDLKPGDHLCAAIKASSVIIAVE